MTEHDQIPDQIDATRALMREKLGARGTSLDAALRKRGSRLPRSTKARIAELAKAEQFAAHPKLRVTLDAPALNKSAEQAQDYLQSIDLSDRRKGWWLGMLGGLVFNLLLFFAIVVGILVWFDVI